MDPVEVSINNWVDVEIRTPFVLSTQASVSATNIVVSRPSDWSILLVDQEKRIRIAFKGCSFPFYECIFTIVHMRLPLSKFEVKVLKYLMVSPFQLQLGSWDYMKML